MQTTAPIWQSSFVVLSLNPLLSVRLCTKALRLKDLKLSNYFSEILVCLFTDSQLFKLLVNAYSAWPLYHALPERNWLIIRSRAYGL